MATDESNLERVRASFAKRGLMSTPPERMSELVTKAKQGASAA